MKRNVDILIVNSTIVTMDATKRVISDGAIAIEGGLIVELGATPEICSCYVAKETIVADTSIVMPGLINTHTHLATSMFKGLAEDLTLSAWLEKSWKYERAFINSKSVAVASKLGILELILGGVTCAVDMYWYPETTAGVACESGFRIATGPVFLDKGDLPDSLRFEDRIRCVEQFVERYSKSALVVPMLMPHGTCTDSPQALAKVKAAADRYNLRVNLHCAETRKEREEVFALYGKTPIKLLASLGFLDGRSVLAHCVHVDDEEIALLADEYGGAFVSHNPMSNMKLGSGIAPIASMRNLGVSLSLGTDGSLSGNDLDMWLAMRLSAALQKCVSGDASICKAEDVVAMATLDAAKAIGMEEKIGSLEVGKRADIILLDIDKPHLVPLYDIYAHLVYSVGRGDVRTVLIDGKIVVKDRVPTTIDYQSSLEDIKSIAQNIRVFS